MLTHTLHGMLLFTLTHTLHGMLLFMLTHTLHGMLLFMLTAPDQISPTYLSDGVIERDQIAYFL